MLQRLLAGNWLSIFSDYAGKPYKGARKSIKLNQVRRVAAEGARREVEEASRNQAEEERSRRPSSPTGFGVRSERWESTLQTPIRRRHVPEVPRTPSPSPTLARLEQSSVGPVSDQERARVTHDLLDLMTVQKLREALRYLGMPVSGIKQDLIQRLAPQLGQSEPGVGSEQPTIRQMKYVLYLWRRRDLQGRVLLHLGGRSYETRYLSMDPSQQGMKLVILTGMTT